MKKSDNLKKNKKENGRNKFVSLLIVVTIFAIAFVVLIKMQQQDSYYLNVRDNSFSSKAQYGSTIVAKDMKSSYPRYYVAYVNDGEYSIYVYNYYETDSQYELEFERLLDQIVDYNAKDYMIRYIYSRGYGTYEELYENLSVIVENENIKIY